MNYDLIFIVIFYSLLILFFYKNRKKVQIQGKIVALYRTKLGLKLMDKISKVYPRILKIIGYVGIITGFAGMFFIFYWLVKGTVNLFLYPSAVPALAPVLPGVKIPGLPVLSFWHWIIAIFIVAVIHEFSHGLYARLHDIKLKSSGFALFGPILAAFVEPDEKIMEKKKKRAQLSVLSAGPFSNIVLGVICFLIITFAMTPIHGAIYEEDGIIVNQVIEGAPAETLKLNLPFVIMKINDKEIKTINDFLMATSGIKVNDKVTLETDKGKFDLITIENPDNKTKGYIGLNNFKINFRLREQFKLKTFLVGAFEWFNMLFFWLFLINIGVGLFNLLPLGPVDGGRMFYLLSFIIVRKKKKAQKFWKYVSLFCLLLILINLMPYLMKLIIFLLKPIIFLIG